MKLEPGAVIAERFRLERKLGEGGMGEVWAARHTSLDIPCAVKFIHAESASRPEVRLRFEREAKAAAQLRSNHVVDILDYGIFEDTPYIAMEYLNGESLDARLARCGRLSPQETFHIVTGVAKALARAHAANIIHRDLKPDNIFLVPEDDGETAKVLDFGVAKHTDALNSNTRTGALVGTPYYMSPEQAQGSKAIDHRADVWSLAIIAYRCVTGELPFNSDALGELLIKIVTYPIPVPSQVASGISASFDQWWARASQRDPNLRYQTAKELARALGMALGVTLPASLDRTPMPDDLPRRVGMAPTQAMPASALPSHGAAAGQAGQSGAYAVQPAAARSGAYWAQGQTVMGACPPVGAGPGYGTGQQPIPAAVAAAYGTGQQPIPVAVADARMGASVDGVSRVAGGGHNTRWLVIVGAAVAVAVLVVAGVVFMRGRGETATPAGQPNTPSTSTPSTSAPSTAVADATSAPLATASASASPSAAVVPPPPRHPVRPPRPPRPPRPVPTYDPGF